jgi:ABC-type multidrug transport system fused ATPase/permease subunit
MLLGLLAMSLAVCLFMYANNSSPSLSEFKKSHPLISLLLIFAVGYVIVYLFSSVLVFLVGILLPTVMMFLHSLLRTRNLKNKITNKMETIGLAKKTPMGLLLQSFGSDDEGVYLY